MKARGSSVVSLSTLGVGLMLLTLSPASAETLCVRGPVYIEAGIIVPPSKVVAQNVGSYLDCPTGSVAYVQNPERQAKTAAEIRQIREAKKEAEEKE